MPIHFEYRQDKASQVVLWLLHQHGGALDKLKLVKLVFFADRDHLARYGRPIVGGSYYAMQHGPLSSELLDDIDGSNENQALPYTLEGHRVLSKESLDEELLSESDIEVLKMVNQEYGDFDTFTLRDITHSLKAWKQNDPGDSSKPLPYEDFFLDLEDSDVLSIIQEDQEAMEFFM